MKNSFRMILCCLSLVGVLIASLGTPVSVRADDGAPPVPETPVATEESVAVESPTQESNISTEPIATEVPAQESNISTEPIVTESPTQESIIPELPVSLDNLQEPVTTEAPTQESVIPEPPTLPSDSPEELTSLEEPPVEGLLESVPEGTTVIILDENGSPELLVSQAAADTISTGDPMWCPANVAPVANTGGCTASYTNFESLLLYLDANEPDQAGVIWIAKDYDSGVNDTSVTSFTLDGSTNFPTMKNYELTIQGGWNGDSVGTITDTDPSEFNATLNILNWNGDITLNDLLFTETNGPGMNVTYSGIGTSTRGAGLAVTTRGSVKLDNVDATKNNSNGVLIDNRSGLGTVSISGCNFNENGTGVFGGLGIYVLSNGEITVNNVTASGNSWEGAKFFNDTLAGSSGDINLTGINTFNNNGMDGLMISSAGDINLRNLTVNGNGLTGAYIYNANGTGNVTFTGTSAFNNNVGAGMYVYSDGVITIHNVTATGNGAEGALLLSGLYGPANQIILTGANVFQGNGGAYPYWYYDLYVSLDGDFAQYRNVTTYGHIILQSLYVDQLPGSLPDGFTFVSGLEVMQTEEERVISFAIPGDLQDAEFSVLYWDGSQWLNLESAIFEDGRLVIDSGHKTENGYFQAVVNFGGVFVLAQKMEQ